MPVFVELQYQRQLVNCEYAISLPGSVDFVSLLISVFLQERNYTTVHQQHIGGWHYQLISQPQASMIYIQASVTSLREKHTLIYTTS